ncbi:MAG: hypothetical protein WC301_00400 [Candidatus Omnitrophota bacterium]|jgi:hypothetical protein
MKIRKGFFVIALLFFSAAALAGCSTIKEGAKGFMGISTRVLEEGRKDAVILAFDYDYAELYAKVKEILKRTRSYIYAQSKTKHMIAFYLSELDTTVVGVFFKETGAKSTQIEVSSPSTFAKELVADRITSVLEGKVTLDELEVKINVEEAETREDRDL